MDEKENTPELTSLLTSMLQNVTLEARYLTENVRDHVEAVIDERKIDKDKINIKSILQIIDKVLETYHSILDKDWLIAWSEDPETQLGLIHRWWCEVAISRDVDAFQYYVSQILLRVFICYPDL